MRTDKHKPLAQHGPLPLKRAWSRGLGLLDSYWAIILLLLTWQAWVAYNNFNVVVMPRPLEVFAEVGRSWQIFLPNALLTLALALSGLAGGMLIGTGLAIAAWSSKIASGLLTPLT